MGRLVLAIGVTLTVLFGTSFAVRADPYLYGNSAVLMQKLQLTFQDGSNKVLTAFNQGWWSPADSTNFNSNTNYLVGYAGGSYYNDYFSFIVSSETTNPVTAASLELRPGSSAGPFPVTLSLYDVTTDTTDLWNKDASPSAAIYNDLGSGILYGSVVVNDPLSPDPLLIGLNQAGIDAINALGLEGYFSVGGTLFPNGTGVTGTEVPEPGSLALLAAALAGVGWARGRAGKARPVPR